MKTRSALEESWPVAVRARSAIVARVRRVGALSLLVGACLSARAASLEVEIQPRFGGAALVFDSPTLPAVGGQLISVTRLDFLVPNIASLRADGNVRRLTSSEA